jgi:hypothetical protein
LKNKLQRALDLAGTHSITDVFGRIEAGMAQIWERDHALIVTEIHDYPKCSVLHFWIAAGEKDAVISLSHDVIAWGRTQGCSRATLAGRKGWLRVLADEGWQASRLTLMEKMI